MARLRRAVGRLASAAAAFRSARGGNVALTFGLALIPVFGMVGAAVDYSRANSVKAAMQAALDASALMLSKDAATPTRAELDRKAGEYFAAEFNRPEAIKLDVKPRYGSNGVLQDLTLGASPRRSRSPWCSTTPVRCRARARSTR